MRKTSNDDGIFVSGHGIVSVSDLVSGHTRLDPRKLGGSLAKINRYAGNTRVPWNDAEHSLLVAKLTSSVGKVVDVKELFLKRRSVVDLERLFDWLHQDVGNRVKIRRMAYLWGMLHDVVEVVCGDTPNPVKKADVSWRSGGTTEDALVAQLKLQQLGSYASVLSTEYTGCKSEPLFVTQAILDLMQDYVKPSDKLALLVEMRYLHEQEVLDYVSDRWQISDATVDFVRQFDCSRLKHQAMYENIDWRNSARIWEHTLKLSYERLANVF